MHAGLPREKPPTRRWAFLAASGALLLALAAVLLTVRLLPAGGVARATAEPTATVAIDTKDAVPAVVPTETPPPPISTPTNIPATETAPATDEPIPDNTTAPPTATTTPVPKRVVVGPSKPRIFVQDFDAYECVFQMQFQGVLEYGGEFEWLYDATDLSADKRCELDHIVVEVCQPQATDAYLDADVQDAIRLVEASPPTELAGLRFGKLSREEAFESATLVYTLDEDFDVAPNVLLAFGVEEGSVFGLIEGPECEPEATPTEVSTTAPPLAATPTPVANEAAPEAPAEAGVDAQAWVSQVLQPVANDSTTGARMGLQVFSDKGKTDLVCDLGSIHRKCDVGPGAFSVDVIASQPPKQGYDAFRVVLNYEAAVNLQKQPGLQENEAPKCNFGSEQNDPPQIGTPGLYALSCKLAAPTTYAGALANIEFECKPGAGTAQIDLVGGEKAKSSVYVMPSIFGSLIFLDSQVKGDIEVADAVLINCTTATPTPTATATLTATATATSTATTTSTATATSTSTATPTSTTTATRTATATSTPTATVVTATPTNTATPTRTATSTASATATHTATATRTPSSTPTATGTPTDTATPTGTSTPPKNGPKVENKFELPDMDSGTNGMQYLDTKAGIAACLTDPGTTLITNTPCINANGNDIPNKNTGQHDHLHHDADPCKVGDPNCQMAAMPNVDDKPGKRAIEIWAIVSDEKGGVGDIALVQAIVRDPTGAKKEPTVQLGARSCADLFGVGGETDSQSPIHAAVNTGGLQHGKLSQSDCQQFDWQPYAGSFLLNNDQPFGKYQVCVQAIDTSSNLGQLCNTFLVRNVVAFKINFTKIDFGAIFAGVPKEVSPGLVTNTGNADACLSVMFSEMAGKVFQNVIDLFGAELKAEALDLVAGRARQFLTPIPSKGVNKIRFSIAPPSGLVPDSYQGTVALSVKKCQETP